MRKEDWVEAPSAHRSLEGGLAPPCVGSRLLAPPNSQCPDLFSVWKGCCSPAPGKREGVSVLLPALQLCCRQMLLWQVLVGRRGEPNDPMPWVSPDMSSGTSISWWFWLGWGGCVSSLQLAEEDVVKNVTHWTLLGHHNSSTENSSTATPPPLDPADVPRGPCWETTVGIVRNSLRSKSLGWFGVRNFLLLMRFLAFPGLTFSLEMTSPFPTVTEHHQGTVSPWPRFSSHGDEIPSWKGPGHAQLCGTCREEHKRPGSLQPCLHRVFVPITTAPLKQTCLYGLLLDFSSHCSKIQPEDMPQITPDTSQILTHHKAMGQEQN